jgi:hypothetical protein
MAWSRISRRIGQEIPSYRRALPKVRSLEWGDWKDMMRAQIALLRAQRDLRSLPTGELVREETVPTGASITDRADDARRIALAINRAATYGAFRPKCLVRSRALRQLLDRAGIAGAEVRVGVQLSNGHFSAHAWVEYGGQVVGDDPAFVARFSPITELHVAALR